MRWQLNCFILVLLISFEFTRANSINKTAATIGDAINLGVSAGKGIISKGGDLIPSIGDVYNFGKQNLLGLPFEVVIGILDKVCSVAISADNSTKPDNEPKESEMNYVLITESENVTIPLTNSSQLWKHPLFKKEEKVVVLITGWTTNPDEPNDTADLFYRAYKSRGNVNFILIDTAKYVDTLYAWSAFNTEKLGAAVGKGLAELIDVVPVENIHLMGTSLGAHMVGSAGRSFQRETSGKLLPRITGLDPAKPCFREGETLNGLGRGDAEFVDIIHSNTGALGRTDPLGDVDFYPNGIVPLMPGCLSIVCSHQRAWEYYAESVYPGNENNFMAKRCGSLHSYDINACIKPEIPMGYATPATAKGNYFLRTRSKSPFGKNTNQKLDDATEGEGLDDTSNPNNENMSSTTEPPKRDGIVSKTINKIKIFG